MIYTTFSKPRIFSLPVKDMFVFTLAMIGVVVVLSAPAEAAAPLSPAQTQSLTDCLVTCTKGDAGCQNSCTTNSAGADYAKAAGACVNACADALVMQGQSQNVKSDLQQCLKVCN